MYIYMYAPTPTLCLPEVSPTLPLKQFQYLFSQHKDRRQLCNFQKPMVKWAETPSPLECRGGGGWRRSRYLVLLHNHGEGVMTRLPRCLQQLHVLLLHFLQP